MSSVGVACLRSLGTGSWPVCPKTQKLCFVNMSEMHASCSFSSATLRIEGERVKAFRGATVIYHC